MSPLLLLGGCLSTAGIQAVQDGRRLPSIVEGSGPQRDRQAILAMAGEYRVNFQFHEMEPSAPGYELRERQRSGAYELVLVVEDTPRRIVLQHLLVHRPAGFVVKHWRQDWHYEANERLEFTEDQTWRLRPIAELARRGAWTQCVYEVSDAPRYCGTGQWSYDSGEPVWRSDAGWRPLPRREYTKRSDYNALGVENEHRITAEGWVHGQRNRKVVRQGEKEVRTLVHERGENDYRRIRGFNFRSGYGYWEASKAYWARIRDEWNRRMKAHGGIRLEYPVDGTKMIWSMYAQSERARQGAPISDREIQALFDPWVGAP